MKLVSICIATYNRPAALLNCLNSICVAKKNFQIDFEVCISDNDNKNTNLNIVNKYKSTLPILYKQNEKNLGSAKNILLSSELSTAKFIWLLGDDDMLLPNSFKIIDEITNNKNNFDVDFFFLNSICLNSDYVFSQEQPFNTNLLPTKITKFSNYKIEKKLEFKNLINPKISFDFLGGQFLYLFKRSVWEKNKNILSEKFIKDEKRFSHLDNTFPHSTIFSKAFIESNAYFCKRTVSINLTGIREWGELWPLVKSVRLVELIEAYKKNGLNFFKFLYCKNFILDTFIPDFFYLYINRKKLGFEYINFYALFFKNIFFPNFYLSIFYYILRKLRKNMVKTIL